MASYMNNAYSVANPAGAVANLSLNDSTGSNWFQRTFDPQGFNAAFNANEAEKARRFNANEAVINRQFQERMSNTAYQRAVADMRKAGLNPYLVYGGGQSASTPSGSTASGPVASSSGSGNMQAIAGIANVIGSLASSAYSIGSLARPRKYTNYYGNFNFR